ncbi:MAG: type II toxin-antitoxin system VapC family toxin [Planctomycetaceae bacterium]
MSYWDTSALAKLYLTEADSLVFQGIADRPTSLRTSPLGQFETILTIRRLEADGRLDPRKAEHLVDELLIDLGDGTVELIAADFDIHAEFQLVLQTCLQRPQPISIRTLDALHLAAAISVDETEFVSNDHRQRAAAVALGLTVLP